MKSIYLIAFLMTSILPPPEVASARMIVFKDCTGWYLREGNRDYRICNYDMVKDYEHKGAVEVSYQRISSCDIRGHFEQTKSKN